MCALRVVCLAGGIRGQVIFGGGAAILFYHGLGQRRNSRNSKNEICVIQKKHHELRREFNWTYQ